MPAYIAKKTHFHFYNKEKLLQMLIMQHSLQYSIDLKENLILCHKNIDVGKVAWQCDVDFGDHTGKVKEL